MATNFKTPPLRHRKRIRHLITFYELGASPAGTPVSGTSPVSTELEESPSKRRKLVEELLPISEHVEIPPPMEEIAQEEVTEKPASPEQEVSAKQRREARSARKSKKNKENTPMKNSKRVFCATEILTTERTYFEALQRLHKNWMIPLAQVISENDIHRIFGNIMSIMRFSETLLGKLERRMKNFDAETTLLGDIFINLVPFLSMYTDYCCNYGEGMRLLNQFKDQDEQFAEVFAACLADSKGMDVQDFCITPVQRVPRYRLLLETLLKSTPIEHPDYTNLESAIQLVSDKAADINKKMNLVESQKKMMELHRRFVTRPLPNEDLVQPWRFLAAEFPVQVIQTADEETDATLYLFNDVFLLAVKQDPSDPNCKLELLTAQPLWNCYLKKLEPQWRLSQRQVPPFQVVNPNGCWNLTIEFKAKFKTDFEQLRDAYLANSADKKQKRLLIKLFPNHEKQEWMAVEPAPTYASNRVSTQILAAETNEFTKLALEELLSENKEIFEARTVTPAKTPKKSRLGKLKDVITPLKWSSKKSVATPAGGNGASLFSPFGRNETIENTPSRNSVQLSNINFESPVTPSSGFITIDKENGGNDSVNQADVIRSTIAKLSQSSTVNKSNIGLSHSDPALSMRKPASPVISSAATPTSARRRHRRGEKSAASPVTFTNAW